MQIQFLLNTFELHKIRESKSISNQFHSLKQCPQIYIIILATQILQMSRKLEGIKAECSRHPKQQIILICLNDDCKQDRLCCVHCAEDRHLKHELMSFRRFEQNMKKYLQDNNRNPQKGKIAKLFLDAETDILKVRKLLSKNLKFLENSFLTRVSVIEQKLETIFSKIHRSFTVSSHQDLLSQIQQNFGTDTFDNLLQMIKVCSEYQVGTASDTKEVIEHEILSFKKKVLQCTTEMTARISILDSQIGKMCFFSKKINQTPYFDSRNKHFDLTIGDFTSIVEKKKNTGSRTAAFANKPLTPINNTVSFKIISNGSGIPSIVIGVGILSIVKAMNFSNCTGFKKGIYAIDQTSANNWGGLQESNIAYSWNHHLQSFSNSSTGIYFTEGDVVTIQIDFLGQLIMFSMTDEEGEQDLFDMPIDSSHRDLYPFVCLMNTGSAVEILSE